MISPKNTLATKEVMYSNLLSKKDVRSHSGLVGPSRHVIGIAVEPTCNADTSPNTFARCWLHVLAPVRPPNRLSIIKGLRMVFASPFDTA